MSGYSEEWSGEMKMMKKYKETKPVWHGYVTLFQRNSRLFVKNRKGQKAIQCRRCGITVPCAVPRVAVATSWGGGHYCLACSKRDLESKKEEYTRAIRDLRLGLKGIKEVEELSKIIQEDPEYQEVMEVMIMAKKLDLDGDDKNV